MRQNAERDAQASRRDRHAGTHDMQILARYADALPEDATDIIRDRLKIAARLIERAAGRSAPAGPRTAWPPILREAADLLACEGDADSRRISIQPTAFQISQAEEALEWRGYVTEAQALAALNIWLRCHALRIRGWQKEAVRRGFSRETAKRRLARAFFLIALGIAKERKPLEEPRR